MRCRPEWEAFLGSRHFIKVAILPLSKFGDGVTSRFCDGVTTHFCNGVSTGFCSTFVCGFCLYDMVAFPVTERITFVLLSSTCCEGVTSTVTISLRREKNSFVEVVLITFLELNLCFVGQKPERHELLLAS